MSERSRKKKIGCGSVLLVLALVGMFACSAFSFSPSRDLTTFAPDASIRQKECISFPTTSGGHYVGQFTEDVYVRRPNGHGFWRDTASNDVEQAYAGQWSNGNAHGEGKYVRYLPDPPFPTQLLTKCFGQFKDGKFVDGTTEGNCADVKIHKSNLYQNYRYTSRNKPGKCSSCRRGRCSS